MKRTAALSATIALLVMPLMVNAQATGGTASQTTADQVARVQALLDQVTALQAKYGVADAASSCPNFTRKLSSGMKGDDVSAMQSFLARDSAIYPEGTVSGYFGALTQKAVQRFQVKNGIVSSGSPATTGYGMVGPRTAQAIVAACGGGSVSYGSGSASSVQGAVGGFLQISPITGTAPLGVKAVATVNTTNSCTGALYVIDWGDGSAVQTIPVASGVCSQATQTFTHVYQRGGSFKITLASGSHAVSANLSINGTSGSIVPGGATQTLTVPANTTSGTTPAASGRFAPLSMAQSETNPLNVSVRFDLTGCPALSLDWGDSSALVTGQNGACPNNTAAQTFNHTYAGTGPFTIVLTRGSQTDTAEITLSQ